jgi:hypothetical protein
MAKTRPPFACQLNQGNESRLTSQRPENLQQVLRIPRGALAASLDGAVLGDLADQIEKAAAESAREEI